MSIRPILFSGKMITRASDVLRKDLKSAPLDLIATSRRMLEAAIRHDHDLIELQPEPTANKGGRKPKHHLERPLAQEHVT